MITHMTRQALAHIFAAGTFIVALALVLAIIGEITLHNKTSEITGMVIGETDAHPTNYARPWDAFSPGTQLASVAVSDDGTAFDATLDVDHTGGFIWHQGYYLKEGTWHQFTFPGTSGDWIRDTASYNLADTLSDYLAFSDDDIYFAFYSCKKQNNEWKCGCRDSTCATSYWMVQSANLRDPVGGDFIQVSPREQVISANQDVTVDITISGSNLGEVYGFDFDVAYNPAVLQYVGVDHGNFLGTNGYPGNVTAADQLCVNVNTSVSGLAGHIACTRVGTGPFPAPAGNVLKTLRFHSLTGISNVYSHINVQGVEIARWPNVAVDGSSPSIQVWTANQGAIIVR